jgi:hypothetical protein
LPVALTPNSAVEKVEIRMERSKEGRGKKRKKERKEGEVFYSKKLMDRGSAIWDSLALLLKKTKREWTRKWEWEWEDERRMQMREEEEKGRKKRERRR